MSKSVFGLVDSESQVERIVENLKSAGFSNNDISVLFPDKGGTRDFAHEQHTKAPEGAATGAGAGGAVGGVLGWLAGIGSLAIPGVGPLIAAGPIMAALAGAGIGAAVAGDRDLRRGREPARSARGTPRASHRHPGRRSAGMGGEPQPEV